MKQRKTQQVKKLHLLQQVLRQHILVATIASMLVLVLCAGIFFYMQLHRYEEGILDVCATQQDAYVQLVLDQINLKQNRDDEEIITDILSTLDASSNKYWTFSSEQSILFVKDVLETNKYKGFTTATYYVSDSAQTFLNDLQINRVTHGEITIEEKNYLASGVTFVYNGHNYRLCLLTNRSVLLDNNRFLGAKIELITMLAVLLLLLIIIPTGFAQWVSKLQLRQEQQREMIATLNRSVSLLNQRLSRQDLHDTRRNVWAQRMLPPFLQKLQQRAVVPLILVELSCGELAAKEAFLTRAAYQLDRSVLRFADDKLGLTLLFVQCDLDAAVIALRPLLSERVQIEAVRVLEAGAEEFCDKTEAM